MKARAPDRSLTSAPEMGHVLQVTNAASTIRQQKKGVYLVAKALSMILIPAAAACADTVVVVGGTYKGVVTMPDSSSEKRDTSLIPMNPKPVNEAGRRLTADSLQPTDSSSTSSSASGPKTNSLPLTTSGFDAGGSFA